MLKPSQLIPYGEIYHSQKVLSQIIKRRREKKKKITKLKVAGIYRGWFCDPAFPDAILPFGLCLLAEDFFFSSVAIYIYCTVTMKLYVDNNDVILNLSQCKAKWNLAHGAHVFYFIFRRQMLYCQKEYECLSYLVLALVKRLIPWKSISLKPFAFK